MEKKFNARDVSMIKRIYQNVDANWQKSLKLKEQIKEKVTQLEQLNKEIEEMEAPVIRRTGGYKSTDLVEKKITPVYNEDGSEKLGKDGRPIKVTKFVLIYGENVIPTEETPNAETDVEVSDNTSVLEELNTTFNPAISD